MGRTCCIAFQSQRTGHNHRTGLPSCTLLVLGHVGTRNSDIMRPDGSIFKRNDIAHLPKGKCASISRAYSMNKSITFAGKAEHSHSRLWSVDGIQTMLPEAAGMGVVGMHM